MRPSAISKHFWRTNIFIVKNTCVTYSLIAMFVTCGFTHKCHYVNAGDILAKYEIIIRRSWCVARQVKYIKHLHPNPNNEWATIIETSISSLSQTMGTLLNIIVHNWGGVDWLRGNFELDWIVIQSFKFASTWPGNKATKIQNYPTRELPH